MLSNFRALDVETANSDLSSICQIGVASFVDGRLQHSWKTLINPQDYFDPINISIHGIDEGTVRDAPTWEQAYPQILSLLTNCLIVSHTAFDRASVRRVCERNALPLPECTWLDTARVARRAWPIFSKSGYGLSNVAEHLSITYQAHNALEDARCAGEVLLRAVADTGIAVEQWLRRVEQPIQQHSIQMARRPGNPEGPLHEEVLVFTGGLSMSRAHAAEMAVLAGCEVDAGVTKRTTILVAGDQDIRKLHGHEKSAKHRKAEALIAQGQEIRILGESDFLHIVHAAGCTLAESAISS